MTSYQCRHCRSSLINHEMKAQQMPMPRGNDQKPWSIIALPMHANIIMAHGAPLLSPSTRAPMTNWRENMRSNPFPWPPQSPSPIHHRSSSSYDETSISNPTASRCTVLSLDSCSGDEPADNHHMWSHLLLNGEAPNSQDDAESFMEVLSSKKFSADQFEPTTCHTLMHPSSQPNFLEIQLNSYKNNNNSNNIQEHHLAPSVTNSYMQSDTSHVKPKLNYPVSQLFPSNLLLGESTKSDNISRYQNITRAESVVLDHPCFSQRNLLDQMTFGGCLNKLDALELRTSEPYLKGSNLGGETKRGYQNSSMRGNGRCAGTNEGKRKRSEDSSEMHSRKTKNDSQMVSSNKLLVPKAKMAEKISALQQLVSPFGKTDQASVLMETINCIRILQKQVQLLSDPYLKSTVSKERDSWGETERKEKAEAKYDLRSKGLCLVPVSSIPQVHRESIRPDYWMPTLRGCFL